MENTPLTYKGVPLVRSGDEMYYGDPKADYIVYLKVISTKEYNGQTISDKIQVMLISTDTSLDPISRIKNQGIKQGLFTALDVGYVWLSGMLEAK